MEKPIKERIADVSPKEIAKPSVAEHTRNIITSLMGWDRVASIKDPIVYNVPDVRTNPSPLKQYETSRDGLHKFHDFYKKHIPHNQRV
jgi:hypothetical protein